MRSMGLILIGLLVTGSANAQSQGDTGRISQIDMGRIYEGRNSEYMRTTVDPTTCLIRKSTKKRECRTRDQWKRLAQQMPGSETAKP